MECRPGSGTNSTLQSNLLSELISEYEEPTIVLEDADFSAREPRAKNERSVIEFIADNKALLYEEGIYR